MSWYLAVLKKYAEFSGRARRKEYQMFALFNFIILFVIGLVDTLAGSPGVLGMLYGLAVLIPSIAVSVRRLHDTDRSGWWFLIALGSPDREWLVVPHRGSPDRDHCAYCIYGAGQHATRKSIWGEPENRNRLTKHCAGRGFRRHFNPKYPLLGLARSPVC